MTDAGLEYIGSFQRDANTYEVLCYDDESGPVISKMNSGASAESLKNKWVSEVASNRDLILDNFKKPQPEK